ncbi:MAG: hypothetical protein AB7S50_13445 [Bacteroidales bacterium]
MNATPHIFSKNPYSANNAAISKGFNFQIMRTLVFYLFLMLLNLGAYSQIVIFTDDFETDKGWVLTGEFERGIPFGLGGEHGNSDPNSAVSGTNVLGVDLTGIGTYPGDYEINLADRAYTATSPVINCSAYSHVSINFQRWLNVEQDAYDNAYIEVSNNGGAVWNVVWENVNTTITDNAWSLNTIDISAIAANQASVQVRFSMGTTDGSWQYSGWNIDDFEVVSVLNYQTRAAGNWNDNATWQVSSGGAFVNCLAGDYPGVNAITGSVTIRDNHSVTLNITPAFSVGSLQMVTGGTDTRLTFQGANALTVTGATLLNANSNGDERGIRLDAGTLTTGSLSLLNTGGNDNSNSYIRISTGTVNVTGDVILNSTNLRTYIEFTDAGTLYVGGNMSGGGITSTAGGGTTAPTSGTVEYNGAGTQQIGTYTYYNLTTSGGGTKTLVGATAVDNNLTLTSGVLQLGNNNLTITNNAINAIQGAAFDVTNMIETNGTGYLIRPEATPNPIVFPVGSDNFYSPASITAISPTAAGTIRVRTVQDFTLGSNFLERYWNVITSLVGRTITSQFDFNATEIPGTPTNLYFRNGTWGTPTGTPSFTATSFTITNTTDITNTSTLWTAEAGVTVPSNTFFSYQTGNWNDTLTWTSDPGGTTYVNIGLPSDGDVVVILSDRTVTLSSDTATINLEVNINEGGILDMSDNAFTNGLAALNGQGTLRLASVNFPVAATNTFVNVGGGTTEYYNADHFTLPAAQATYNNLKINTSIGKIATQLSDITLNGNLQVKQGTYRINDNVATTRLILTINGDVTIDNGAFISVGNGSTNSTIDPLGIIGVTTLPFLDYYENFHRVVLKGNFTNNGTVRFTNLNYPIFNAFPPLGSVATSGAATVYFQGATDNTLTCNGTTDFYNLVLDKGVDQSFSLTVYSSAYPNFRLFGANIAGGESGGSNPNLKKALWIRTGTLILQGLTIIPSLSEGTWAEDGDPYPLADPNSDYFIPANGALTLDGTQVIVLSTADDYGEVNVAYGVAGGTGLVNGIGTGGCSSFSILGKFKVNNGYFSTRESGGIITWDDASGQFVIRGVGGQYCTVDAKQFRSFGGGGGLASYDQSGGTFILRGRFKYTPLYSTVAALKQTSPSTVRDTDGSLGATLGTFNLNEPTNVFTMSGGIIQIYDDCGNGRVFDVLSSSGNINVTDGTIKLYPTLGTGGSADAAIHYIRSNAPLGNLEIFRKSGSTTVQLDMYPLVVLKKLDITSGVLKANNLNVTVGGDFTIANGTTYTPGANWTIFNGTGSQSFSIGLATLAVNKLKIDKPSGTTLTLSGAVTTLSVNDSLMIVKGTLADGGKTISLAGTATSSYLYNSGVHSGTGKMVLNDNVPQMITGDGNGIFQNLELNNNTGTAPISLGANTTINGTLTLSQDKLFNISTYNLKLGASATIAGTISGTRFIQSSGNAGDGGITKVYSSSSTSFIFPIGAPSTNHAAAEYSPATITFGTNPTVFGSITVVPVGYEHPNTTTKGRSLTYFWRVKSAGFTLGAATVTHTFNYSATDNDVVTGGDITEAGYVAESYNNTTYSWTNYSADTDVDETTNIIGGAGTSFDGVNYIDGEFTAGDDDGTDPFGVPTVYYSRANTRWNLASTWSIDPVLKHTGAAAATSPGINDVVVIGNNNTVNLTANASCASLQIEDGSVLDIYTWSTTASNFGMVINHPGGNGLFRLTTVVGSPKLFTFPGGDFSDFNINSGTTEFYDIDGTAGALYILPANVTQYGNLILRALNGDNIVLPNNNLTTINGDLTFTGNLATAWIAMSWNTNIAPYNNATLYNPTIEKTIHVTGNLNVDAGTFIFMPEVVPQHMIVEGDVIVGSAGSIDIQIPVYGVPAGAPVANTIDIGGSLINNSTTAPYLRLLNGTHYCNLRFFGNNNINNDYISGSGTTTIFNKVTIDKGTSQADSLIIDIGGTLTTPTNNWLTLSNGTLVYRRTDPSTDFTITEGTAFTIPSTAGLYIDYPNNATNRNILIANSASNTNDLYLNGKLTLVSGNVYVGQITSPDNNNDIEYSGGGGAAIDISGGNLIVNGQIRRNTGTTNGVLSYIQSGGNLIVNGRNDVPGNAKLEITDNPGNVFNMSGGTISIVRGGGTTFGDLYIKAPTSSVTGGEIIFSQGTLDEAQNYILEANVALNDLTITGKNTGTARNATVTLFSSPLTMKGDLTISNANSIFDANTNLNIDVTIKGGFTNNGTYNHYENLTTFSGGTQTIAGSTATDFYDLLVNPVTSLSLIRDISVFNDLTLSSGQLLCDIYNINLDGDITNNAYYDCDSTQGGVILNGSVLQYISGTGTFGRLELNNSEGARLNNDITLQRNLKLTSGILDMNDELLTLGERSIIEGSSFGTTKMITSDGVFSNVGLRKYFGIYSGTDISFTFPIGTSGKYTPAVLSYTNNTQVGYVRINNINSFHPGVLDPNNVLHYFWEVESSGIIGFAGSLVLNYKQEDVWVNGTNTEALYIAAALLNPPLGTTWQKSGPGGDDFTDNVYDLSDSILFDFPLSDNLSGEYTCGIDAALPLNVPQYKSIMDGNWNVKTIWEQTGGDPYTLTTGPNGFIVTISPDDTVSIDAYNSFTYRMTINGTLRVVYPYVGNNFGTVYGSGTLYLENSTFPAGRYTDFFDCSNTSTLEYGGNRSYALISDLYSSIPKLHFTGTGRRILPNKDLTICKQLLINVDTLDNSVNNKKLTIQGTMERYNSSLFFSGSGAGAIVSFAGSDAQIIGDTIGNFTGANAFNHFEINNSAGLTINDNGAIEVTGKLLLTNGNITTSSTDSLIITNTDIDCVTPLGGSASSFVDGPLIKKINSGDEFFYPIGKGSTLGNKLTIDDPQTGPLLWTAEFFTPNPTYTDFIDPLTFVNSKEYWTVSAPATSEAVIKLNWNPSSDLTPLMTENGITDMRVANYNTDSLKWDEIESAATGNNDYGTVYTFSWDTIPASGSNDYTIACINVTKPRARLDPVGAVCGAEGIPVTFTGVDNTNLYYIIEYKKGGVLQDADTIYLADLPYILPTEASGMDYQLISFKYNSGASTGVVDPAIITSYTTPPAALAGIDQSLCGATSTILNGNNPAPFSGMWNIISGLGGSFGASTSYNSAFSGNNGTTYELEWVITNGGCSSSDTVIIAFPINPVKPVSFILSSANVCQGEQDVLYSVANDPSVTYTWEYSGSNASGYLGDTDNSVTIDFDITATPGIMSVYTTNGCGNSAPLEQAVAVNSLPTLYAVTGGGSYCAGGTGVEVKVNASTSGVDYILYRDGVSTLDTVHGGGAISFGLQTIAGSYTVLAVNATTLCSRFMSGSATVSVNPLPTITISATPGTICFGDFSDLNATGGVSYSWTPFGEIDDPNIQSPRFTPLANPTAVADTTTFTVTVIDVNLCSDTDSVDVIVNRTPETGPQYHLENP